MDSDSKYFLFNPLLESPFREIPLESKFRRFFRFAERDFKTKVCLCASPSDSDIVVCVRVTSHACLSCYIKKIVYIFYKRLK